MITRPARFCDGVTRRSFLRIGGLAMGGLALPELLRAETAGAAHDRSVIMVYLTGGLSHQDTFDLKPDAPAEVCGEFKPIASVVPGLDVCEHLPYLAASADKYAIVRSLVGQRDEHSSFQSTTGITMTLAQQQGRPHLGSVISRELGPRDPIVPPFIDLFPVMQHRPYNSPGPGILGVAHAAARLSGDDLELMTRPPVEAERFGRRRDLLGQFDTIRARLDGMPIDRMDGFYRRAFDVLTSEKVATALDVSKEDPRLRDRYGLGSSKHLGDGAPMWNDQLLQARRLVEAGARCVTVAYGFWDTHGNNFGHLKEHLPLYDRGVSALIEDIYARGLDDRVTVVVWGEFGRTPKINKDGGRDHWAAVNHALMAGGGMKVGQVIGSTDRLGAYAVSRPIHYVDVLATIYRNLGIDPHGFVPDQGGRPTSILSPTSEPIRELV